MFLKLLAAFVTADAIARAARHPPVSPVAGQPGWGQVVDNASRIPALPVDRTGSLQLPERPFKTRRSLLLLCLSRRCACEW